tara:strand:+ start:5965 stop:6207 length:243 start_codon:yes stop_codon:yes gene_type:complete
MGGNELIEKLEKFIFSISREGGDVEAYDISVKLSDGEILHGVTDVSISDGDVRFTCRKGDWAMVVYTTTNNVSRWSRSDV